MVARVDASELERELEQHKVERVDKVDRHRSGDPDVHPDVRQDVRRARVSVFESVVGDCRPSGTCPLAIITCLWLRASAPISASARLSRPPQPSASAAVR